jgi:hypothetical protein
MAKTPPGTNQAVARITGNHVITLSTERFIAFSHTIALPGHYPVHRLLAYAI